MRPSIWRRWKKLPLVVAVANNQFAYSTPTSSQFACAHLVDRAAGYGVDGHTVDGTDLAASLEVMGRAIARARAGHGPQLVIGSLLRLTGHGEHDDASYVPAAARDSALGRDCLEVARQRLLDQSWATAAELQAWEGEMAEEVRSAVATAQTEPAPDADRDDWKALSTNWSGSGTAA